MKEGLRCARQGISGEIISHKIFDWRRPRHRWHMSSGSGVWAKFRLHREVCSEKSLWMNLQGLLKQSFVNQPSNYQLVKKECVLWINWRSKLKTVKDEKLKNMEAFVCWSLLLQLICDYLAELWFNPTCQPGARELLWWVCVSGWLLSIHPRIHVAFKECDRAGLALSVFWK
jgi:hypothetical protein